MELVFFKCDEFDKLPGRIQQIILQGKDVPPKPNYIGVSIDDKNYRLNPEAVEITKSGFKLKDIEKPLLPKRWKTFKKGNKINRETPQSKKLLEEKGILPFKEIKLSEYPGKMLWNHKSITSLEHCNFFALMIDPTTDSIVGIAQANIETPETPSYDVLKTSTIIPHDITYIYISDVNIHPDYIGGGYCKPLLTFLMNKITALSPSVYTHFSIINVSFVEEGIPACVCYVRSGTENGYDVYYHEDEALEIKKMVPELCYKSDDETRFNMPSMYYYVKKRTKGGTRRKSWDSAYPTGHSRPYARERGLACASRRLAPTARKVSPKRKRKLRKTKKKKTKNYFK